MAALVAMIREGAAWLASVAPAESAEVAELAAARGHISRQAGSEGEAEAETDVEAEAEMAAVAAQAEPEGGGWGGCGCAALECALATRSSRPSSASAAAAFALAAAAFLCAFARRSLSGSRIPNAIWHARVLHAHFPWCSPTPGR